MAIKKIAKSIRLSDEVYGYIMEMPGNGFNEKFENIILEAKKEESARKERLAYLQEDIDCRERELYDLYNRYSYLNSYFDMFSRMRGELDSMKMLLEKAIGEQSNEAAVDD